MRKHLAILLMALACAQAAAAPASAESLEKLIVLTKAESLMDSMHAGMENVMRQAMKQAAGEKRLTPEQQRALEIVPAKYTAAIRAELSWAMMKPDLMKMYQDVFTQEEVDGMVAFYSSPAGQAVVEKMPVLLNRSLALGQAKMQAVMPKMMRVLEEALNEAGIMTR